MNISDEQTTTIAKHMAHAALDWIDFETDEHSHTPECSNWGAFLDDATTLTAALASTPEVSDDERAYLERVISNSVMEDFAGSLAEANREGKWVARDVLAAGFRRGPVPADTPSEEGVWTCGHCGHGSAAHGMENHEAYKCAYDPVWKPGLSDAGPEVAWARYWPTKWFRPNDVGLEREKAAFLAGLASRPTPPEDVAAQAIRDAADAWHAEHKGTKPLVYSWLWNYAAALAAVPADGETERLNAGVVLAALDNILAPSGSHRLTQLSNMRYRVESLREHVAQYVPIPEGSVD